ncbi:MAG: NAD(P)/FAD-dependent oxidoreductase [Myxococcota bacterium]
MQAWDVIIVGGGPSGTSTALHLSHRDPSWGARTLILEKARYPRPKLCGGGVTEYGTKCLERIGLDLHDIPNVPIDELRMVRGKYQGSFRQGHGLTIIRRDQLDAWLASKASDRGVKIHEGETVLDVETQAGGVRVKTDRGEYEARVLVAADGSNGLTRRRLGLEDKERVGRAMEILTPADDPGSRKIFEDRTAVFDFSASVDGLQGYYWDFPCWVDGRPHLNRGVYDARTSPERARADLKAIFGAALAERGLDINSIQLMGHPIRWYEPRGRFSLPRVLLVGDNAGADPLIGEGIAFALGYGDIASAAIIDAFARRDFSFRDYGRRITESEYGEVLETRWVQARQLYRHKNPMIVPMFSLRRT